MNKLYYINNTIDEFPMELNAGDEVCINGVKLKVVSTNEELQIARLCRTIEKKRKTLEIIDNKAIEVKRQGKEIPIDYMASVRKISNEINEAEAQLKKLKSVTTKNCYQMTLKIGEYFSNEEVRYFWNQVCSDQIRFTEEQAKEVARAMHEISPEHCMNVWALLQKNTYNLFPVHPYIEKLMVSRATGQELEDVGLNSI